MLAAGLEVDPDPLAAPLVRRHAVQHGVGDVERHAAERVDEPVEAAEVDHHVVVDRQSGELTERLLERRRAGILAAREQVGMRGAEPVQRVQDAGEPRAGGAGRARRQRHAAHVARHGEQGGAVRLQVDRRDHHRVGAQAGAAGARVGAEQHDVEPARASATRGGSSPARSRRGPPPSPRARG